MLISVLSSDSLTIKERYTMKKTTMAVAALLTVLAAPVLSVAYADEATTAASCKTCKGCAGKHDCKGCTGCKGDAGCKGCKGCAGENH